MIKIKLLQGEQVEVVRSKISAFNHIEGGFDNYPPIIYRILIDGAWFFAADKAEFERVKALI